jgi:serine/threonine protein kinase
MNDSHPGEQSGHDASRIERSGRFRVLRLLGKGEMGLVYAAHDLALDRRVALKTLRVHDPDEIYRLKKEFRALSRISHPNLVQFYELFSGDGHCFFTMELVHGLAFSEHLTSCQSGDGRFRAAFSQLAAAISALHRETKLHRDIKPTNVLVDERGRVVLLDFGLVSSSVSRISRESRVGTLAGTLAYMAPEQAWGEDISSAADWYSFGVLLYEALAGRLPYDGHGLRALMASRSTLPPPVRDFVADAPIDLGDLALRLLDGDSSRRPSAKEVLAVLAARPEGGAVESSAGSSSQPRLVAPLEPERDSIAVVAARAQGAVVEPTSSPFVGRGVELASLAEALIQSRESLSLVTIDGPSGIGKTALVEHFLQEGLQGDALVLRSSCHPHESLPYRALDGLLDDLTRALLHWPRARVATLLPPNLAALRRIFPVLGRLPEHASTPDTTAQMEAHELRHSAFGALQALLSAVAADRPVVAWIDDFQWSDRDSLAFLRTLFAARERIRLLLIVSLRGEEPGEGVNPAFLELERMFEVNDARLRVVRVGPLGADAVRSLTREVFARSRAEVSEGDLDVVAEEACGSPFFATELALDGVERAIRGGVIDHVRVSDLIQARIAALPEGPRRLLELVAVAGRPVDEIQLCDAFKDLGDGAHALSVLGNQRLIRDLPRGERRAITTYHDQIRRAALATLEPAAVEALHARLARALESSVDPDPLLLLDHYLNAHDFARAAEYAYLSAETAARALAFHRAVTLYRRALELSERPQARWGLLEKLGDALVNAGQAADGARYLGSAAEALAVVEPANRSGFVRLKRRAAEQLLRSGQHAEGLVILREVLELVRLPYLSSPATIVLSIAVNRSRLKVLEWRLFGAPRGREVDSASEQLEACWSAGLGLSLFDPLRAFDYQVRHSLLAHDARSPAHIARAVSTEGLLLAWEGGSSKRRRGERLQADGERLARETGSPNIEAYVLVMRAGHAWIQARFRDCLALCAQGEALCRERCVGAAWELANFHWLAGNSLSCLGEMGLLRARLPEWICEARELDDQYRLALLRLGRLNLGWVAADSPDAARREIDDGVRPVENSAFFGYLAVLARGQVELYVGDGPKALELATSAWSRMRASGMLRVQRLRVDLRDLAARAAIQVASAPSVRSATRRRMIREARAHATAIEVEDAHWTAPVVDALRAGLATLEGDRGAALECYERSAFGYEQMDMGLHASAARYALGALRADEVGREIADRQGEWLRARGVVEPARMVRALLPALR